MAKGYSIRKGINYYRGMDGKWKLHSMASWDENGYTRKWATLEGAEEYAQSLMARKTDPDAQGYVQYCKIYLGNQYIKTVTR